MKILFLFALAVLVSFISINEIFAVEYKDNTGYTPKWAKTMNQEEVLNFCGLVPVPSQDADWCKEFGAYVNQQLNSQQPTSPISIPIVENQISDKVQQSTDLITIYYTLDGIFTPEQNSGMVNLIVKGKVSPTLFQDHNSIQRVKLSILDEIFNPQLTTTGDYSVTLYPKLTLGETYKIQVEYNDQTTEKLFKFDESHITRKQPEPEITQLSNSEWVEQDIKNQLQNDSNKIKDYATLLIYSNYYWSGSILDASRGSATTDGSDNQRIPFLCTNGFTYASTFQLANPPESRFDTVFDKMDRLSGELRISKQGGPFLTLAIIQDGKLLDKKTTTSEYGIVSVAGQCESGFGNGGGCLIATATYGSELAPQVQQLRELRDNQLLQTESGKSFMTGFNQWYYSFSPTIADWERESPIFKEAVKIAITPMISSLSILNHVNMDSEADVLGYGISLIVLNLGMYVGVPVFGIVLVRKKF